MTERRRRLVEVAFPLEEVSEHSRKDPYLGPPHPQTIHRWWARRPLPACRAFIYASLVDDPGNDTEREELLKEVADLASWGAIRKPDQVVRPREKGGSGLTGAELLERARRRILECNGGRPPRLLDPFAGGGAIPLEALRLGCEVEASDLNPVAVLILKGTVEYPQKYGRPLAEQVERKRRGERDSIAGVNGDVPSYILEAAGGSQASFTEGDLVESYRKNPLATDVRYWGNWMLERAREELAEFYPQDPDGSVPVAYLWSRTVPCPNCGAEMPLIRQYWLARTDKKKVALRPVLDLKHKRVDFDVVEGANVTGDPGEATTSRGDTLCLLCNQVVKAAYVHEAGRRGEMGARLTSVVLEAKGGGGKRYRASTNRDASVFQAAANRALNMKNEQIGDLPAIPDEPVAYHPQYMLVREYGLDQWGKLFNARQLVALSTLSAAVREAHAQMIDARLDPEYARAVDTYLAFAVDRSAGENSTLTRWNPVGPKAQGALGLQALPMTWDFAELNIWGGSVGDAYGAIDILHSAVSLLSEASRTNCQGVYMRDAREPSSSQASVVLTDPPYYDSINYADISDFYYVWLKRSVGSVHPDLLGLPLTPKKQQIVMNVYAQDISSSEDRTAAARLQYVEGMSDAFRSIRQSLDDDAPVGVVFAHTDSDAWATLIDGLIATEIVPDASWPLDTEIRTKLSAVTQARLKTSVWMACNPREADTGEAFIGDVLREMQPVIRERLLYFWSKGIRGADFFISAIGPALSVFGRHSRVLRPDGSEVTVRDFLDLVRRESTQVALEQVLQGADLGIVDPITREYVTWVWSYSRAPLEAGETIALCLATGTDYHQAVRPGSIATEVKEKSKKLVKLRTIRERGRQDEDLGEDSPARPAPLIDQLQRAGYLWGLNRTDDLASYRASLNETRWAALRVLGQAVAECLPDGDEDRRLVHGLLGSNVMARAARAALGRPAKPAAAGQRLPGFEEGGKSDG
jgi:putative DNA methylase